MSSLTSPKPSAPKAQVRKRPLWERVDRRVIRSVTYASLIFILFVLFKTTEWFIEHTLSGSKNQSVIAGLAIALGLAIVFQMFHHRVERAIERWLNRSASERLEGLIALAHCGNRKGRRTALRRLGFASTGAVT